MVSNEEGRKAIHHLGQHLRHLMSAHLSHKGGKLHHRAAGGECWTDLVYRAPGVPLPCLSVQQRLSCVQILPFCRGTIRLQ